MRCMNCGWDNHSNTTVCLKCGQPLRMPENYANSQDIFISKEGHGEAIPKPTVLNVSSNEEKCRKTVDDFPQQMKKRIILLLYSQL